MESIGFFCFTIYISCIIYINRTEVIAQEHQPLDDSTNPEFCDEDQDLNNDGDISRFDAETTHNNLNPEGEDGIEREGRMVELEQVNSIYEEYYDTNSKVKRNY